VRILLTGGSGFIGSAVVSLLAPAHEVIVLGRTAPVAGATDWIEHDLASPLDAALLPARVDAVVHLAQSRRYREFPEGAADMYAINTDTTFRLLEYARAADAARFLFASTGGIYAPSYERLVETDPVDPLDFYLTSKLVAESLIGNYRRFFHTVVFRFFFVYGPGQRRMLVPSLLDRVRNGEHVTIQGDPGLRVNPIYVDDAARAFEPALALARSDLFNVAGDEVVSIRELVELMAQASGVEARIVAAPATHSGDLVGDNTRMKTILRVEPRTSLSHGLSRTLAALER
jgi:UDP-glucose 4-epimerase